MTEGFEDLVKNPGNDENTTYPKLIKNEYLWVPLARIRIGGDYLRHWHLQTRRVPELRNNTAYKCAIALEHYIGEEERLMKVWNAIIVIDSKGQARLADIKEAE